MEIINNRFVISKMTINDLEAIKEKLYSNFDDFWNYNIFKSELENINSQYLKATFNNDIIAFAGIWIVQDEAHITNIVTHKKYRNQGVASLLLNEIISNCKKQNINSLTLEVNEKNIIAQNLYKKFDFKILGERKKYYNNNSAIIMTLYFS